MKPIIVDIQPFPCFNYIKMIARYSNVKIDKYENFRKMSFHNRYVVASANGLLNLSIPIAGGREQRAVISKIKIDDSADWRTRHWRSITSAYSKAPFFEYYKKEVEGCLFNNEEYLFQFNISILNTLLYILNINTSIGFTSEFERCEPEYDFRNKFLPKSFQKVNSGQYKYSQVFEDRLGFQPNLSILDLLFCEGPNSTRVLEKGRK